AFEKVRAQMEKTAGQIYNVGGGMRNSVSLREVIDEIHEVTGTRLQFDMQTPRPGDQLYYVTDFGKLHKHTGWMPQHNVRQTIEAIHNWWKEQRGSPAPVRLAPIAPPILAPLPEAASRNLPWSIPRGPTKARPTSAAGIRITRWSYFLHSIKSRAADTNR